MKKHIRLILLLFSVGWMPTMAMAINLLYSHYTHNVQQTAIVHSFPFLHYGINLLVISGAWMALVGFTSIAYILGHHSTGKWSYPFDD